jgi:VanZ family protein
MKPIYKTIFIAPAIIASIAIFIVSQMSHPPMINFGIEWNDKLLHLMAYFIYGLSLIVLFLGGFNNIQVKKAIWFVLIFGALFAISDEIHQSFVPGRDADIFDWLADCIGISISLTVINLANKIIQKLKLNFSRISH